MEQTQTPDISVVIPLYNEEESISELISWIDKVMQINSFRYEVVMVDDGSSDNSWKIVRQLAANNQSIKGIRFQRNYGKSAALYQGFAAAKGNVVITMDADLQDSPDEIPELYRMITQDGFDLVSGWKKKRYDPINKTLPSKLYNGTVRTITGIKLHDFNCGLKAYRRKVVKSIEVYGEMHRYIPVIAKKAGFKKIGEKEVHHYKRKYGTSKYGFGRIKGLLDILTILFIAKYGKKPMHLFGSIGAIIFFLGFIAAIYLGTEKLYYVSQGIRAKLVTDSPYFYLSLTSMVIGTQLFLAGFIGELVSRNSASRNDYQIDEKI
jgi:glycosyltransferase involved in cell wall biosynthesis